MILCRRWTAEQTDWSIIKKIAETAPLILKEGGYILLEAGIGQAADIRQIFSEGGLSPVSVLKDLAGIERCVILKK